MFRSPPSLLILIGTLLLVGCGPTPAPPTIEAVVPAAKNPYEAWKWRRATLVSEDGKIAPDAWRRGRAQWLRAVQRADESALSFDWIERGPTNVGGRTRSLLIDPQNRDHLLAGAVSGGIWRSSDRGQSWAMVDDWLPSLAIGCLAADPQNPDILYAGTGEGFFNGDAVGGAGLLRSTDRGTSWELLPATAAWGNVCRVDVSRQDSQLLLAGLRYGGIYRSTDGGEDWTQVRSAQGSFYVEFDPSDDQKAVAHVLDHSGDWIHRAAYSEDGGMTWANAAGLEELFGFGSRIELAYAPSNPSIVYASVAMDDGVIWRSEDGGRSYTKKTTTGSSAVSWYANPLWVDPTDPEFLLTGGLNVWKSTDGGGTLTQISSGYIGGDQPHVDLHFFREDPGFDGITQKAVYVCTDGGVWRTDDVYTASTQSGWTRCDQEYVAMQLYGAAGHGPEDMIIGGTQDNGTQRLLGEDSVAHMTFGGDGGFCAIDPDNPHHVYGEYIFLQIFRSRNRGHSAAYITEGLPDAGSRANFIAPFILDPNDAKVMLAGGHSLWRTPDAQALGQPEWQQIRQGMASQTSAIAVAEGNSDIIWVGLNNGEIHRTEDGTELEPEWWAVDNNLHRNPLPNRYVTRILIDPWNSDRVYVSLGGFESNNLWRSDDAGSSWEDISGDALDGLPHVPVRGIARHPADFKWILVGTEMGVFSSEDGGLSWTASTFGPAGVSVDELVFMHHSEVLLAATHGRGLFTADLGTHVLEADAWGLAPGGTATVRVRGAEPGSLVLLGWSTTGEGRTFVPPLGATLDIADPHEIRRGWADASGEIRFYFDLPDELPNRQYWVQAIGRRAVSNVLRARQQ